MVGALPGTQHVKVCIVCNQTINNFTRTRRHPFTREVICNPCGNYMQRMYTLKTYLSDAGCPFTEEQQQHINAYYKDAILQKEAKKDSKNGSKDSSGVNTPHTGVNTPHSLLPQGHQDVTSCGDELFLLLQSFSQTNNDQSE